jgi:membrane associated rhomboid family serine protease
MHAFRISAPAARSPPSSAPSSSSTRLHASGTLLFVFIVQIPAWVYLGGWFHYQLIEGNFGLASASANGGGVAFFAHIGGFAFGALVTLTLRNAGRVVPQGTSRHSALAPL